MRGAFLDISKAFDNVWHEELIYKLQQIWYFGSFIEYSNRFPKTIGNKELYSMVEVLTGLMLTPVYHKVQLWDLYFS